MDARAEFPQATLAASGRRAHLPRRWTGDRVTAVTTLALVFPLAAALYERGLPLLLPLVAALAVAVGWTLLFTRLRGKNMNWHAVPTAIVFTLLVRPRRRLAGAAVAELRARPRRAGVRGRGYSFLAIRRWRRYLPLLRSRRGGGAGGLLARRARRAAGAALPPSPASSRGASFRCRHRLSAGCWSWPRPAVAGAAHGEPCARRRPPRRRADERGCHQPAAGLRLRRHADRHPRRGRRGHRLDRRRRLSALLGSVFAPLIDRIVVYVNVRRRRQRPWPTSTR